MIVLRWGLGLAFHCFWEGEGARFGPPFLEESQSSANAYHDQTVFAVKYCFRRAEMFFEFGHLSYGTSNGSPGDGNETAILPCSFRTEPVRILGFNPLAMRNV